MQIEADGESNVATAVESENADQGRQPGSASSVAAEHAGAAHCDRKYLPTPDQIVAGCLAIQAEWTPLEKSRRKAFSRDGGPPMLPTLSEGIDD